MADCSANDSGTQSDMGNPGRGCARPTRRDAPIAGRSADGQARSGDCCSGTGRPSTSRQARTQSDTQEAT